MNRIFLGMFLLFNANMAFSQFNTVLPRPKEVEIQPTVVSQENVSNNVDIKPVTKTTPEEPAQMELFRLRKYLALPMDTVVTTSNYGWRTDPINGEKKFHKGIDLDADYNYVYSVMPGKIKKAGKDKRLGNFVEIESGDFRIIYGHLYQNLVNIKQAVEAGEPIGISGSTGRSTGEHLHFQVLFKDQAIDPKPLLNYIQSVADFARNELSNMIYNEIKSAGEKKE